MLYCIKMRNISSCIIIIIIMHQPQKWFGPPPLFLADDSTVRTAKRWSDMCMKEQCHILGEIEDEAPTEDAKPPKRVKPELRVLTIKINEIKSPV